MIQNVLFAVIGILGGLVATIWLTHLRPKLVFHPDIHWSEDTMTYRVRLRNNGHIFRKDRAGDEESHEKRADDRWGHIFDLKVTATLVIPCEKKPRNEHRIALPLGIAGEYPHIQPGDTRFITLTNPQLTPAGRKFLANEAKARGLRDPPDEKRLFHAVAHWSVKIVEPVERTKHTRLVMVAVGNDAFGGGRRCWEARYNLEESLFGGDFPDSDEKGECARKAVAAKSVAPH